jgi:hypothetical protein
VDIGGGARPGRRPVCLAFCPGRVRVLPGLLGRRFSLRRLGLERRVRASGCFGASCRPERTEGPGGAPATTAGRYGQTSPVSASLFLFVSPSISLSLEKDLEQAGR